MTALIVIGIILLVIFGIGAIRATVYIDYADDISLYVRVLGIKIGILPKKEKKVNINKYSAKKFRKMLKKKEEAEKKKLEKKKKKDELKKQKKLEKKQKKDAEKQYRKDHPDEPKKDHKKLPLGQIFPLVGDVLSTLFSRFGRHFRIKVARLNITVATGDAATTAVLYGVAVQGVEYILALLDKMTNVKYRRDAEVNVNVDYLSDATAVDIALAFSLRVWHVFDLLFRVAFAAVKNLLKPKK